MADTPIGLTRRDLVAICDMSASLGPEWYCETELDPHAGLWASLVRQDSQSNETAMFAIHRVGTRLVLIDARLTAGFHILGIYHRARTLAGTVRELIGCHPWL